MYGNNVSVCCVVLYVFCVIKNSGSPISSLSTALLFSVISFLPDFSLTSTIVCRFAPSLLSKTGKTSRISDILINICEVFTFYLIEISPYTDIDILYQYYNSNKLQHNYWPDLLFFGIYISKLYLQNICRFCFHHCIEWYL